MGDGTVETPAGSEEDSNPKCFGRPDTASFGAGSNAKRKARSNQAATEYDFDSVICCVVSVGVDPPTPKSASVTGSAGRW